MVQHESFAELLSKFLGHKDEKVKHDLAKLFQFVDSDSTFCLMSRLSKTTVNDDLKHPILFPTNYFLVILMLGGMHGDNHHERTKCVRSLV